MCHLDSAGTCTGGTGALWGISVTCSLSTSLISKHAQWWTGLSGRITADQNWALTGRSTLCQTDIMHDLEPPSQPLILKDKPHILTSRVAHAGSNYFLIWPKIIKDVLLNTCLICQVCNKMSVLVRRNW